MKNTKQWINKNVMIYYDPITEHDLEGEAQIKKIISSNHGMIYAIVHFISDDIGTTYERRVLSVGKNKNIFKE